MDDGDQEGFHSRRHAQPIRVADWQDAEELAAWHMTRTLGFADAKLTGSGNDGGVDVEAVDASAQVKHYSQPVGAPEVQQLRGAAHGVKYALIYALSGFTPAARDYRGITAPSFGMATS